MRTRRGFAAIALVVSASILLFIWAGAQHFTTSSIRRRVRLAEAQRAAGLMALSSAEQLVVFLPALLALRILPAPPPGTEGAAGLAEDVGAAFAGWKPGEPLVVDVPLPWMTASMKHVPVGVEASRVTAYLQRVEGGVPGSFDYSKDCEAYGSWRSQSRWSDAGEDDPEFVAARAAKYPGWGPLKMRGLARFEATALAEGLGVRLRTTAQILRQITLESSPCPAQDPPEAGLSLGVHPVELGRRLWTARGGPPLGELP